jgi:hypothetical protein
MKTYLSEYSTNVTEALFNLNYDPENAFKIDNISLLSNSIFNINNNDYELIEGNNDLYQNQLSLDSFRDVSLKVEEDKKNIDKEIQKKEPDNNKKQIFLTEEKKSSVNDSIEFEFSLKKKRGRKINNDSNQKNSKIHDKFSSDNLLRKIQVHYLSFIRNFLNDILKYLNYKERFFKLDYKFTKIVNKKFVKELKIKTIGEIIRNIISDKYRKYESNKNKEIYEIVKKNEVLNNILSENYLKLFKKVYFKSKKKLNLKEYGLDIDIILSKDVKMYEDLLKKDKDGNKEYEKELNKCAIRNFMPNSIFTF